MVALLNKPIRLAVESEAAPHGDAGNIEGIPAPRDAHPTPARGAAENWGERRMFPRTEGRARVPGKRLDHSIPALRQPHLTLALRDLSVGGLSAISQTPLGVGERLTVFFPPQAAHKGWDVSGRVLRCEPAALGYRVAVEFEALPMAA